MYMSISLLIPCLDCYNFNKIQVVWLLQSYSSFSKIDLFYLSSLVWVAITEYHRVNGLNNKHLVFSSGGWKFEIKVSTWLGPGESPLLVHSWLPSCYILHVEERKRGSKLSLVSSWKGSNSIIRAPLSRSNYLPKSPSSNIITLRIKASAYELEG